MKLRIRPDRAVRCFKTQSFPKIRSSPTWILLKECGYERRVRVFAGANAQEVEEILLTFAHICSLVPPLLLAHPYSIGLDYSTAWSSIYREKTV
jgi:hypothetical protein